MALALQPPTTTHSARPPTPSQQNQPARVLHLATADRAFAALADPTRRAGLERVNAGTPSQALSAWLQRLDRFDTLLQGYRSTREPPTTASAASN
jgi:hypothetical protein